MKDPKLELDQDKFYQVLDTIREAAKNKKGIFRNGVEHFLPQWNLPEELEFNPRKRKPKKPYETALYLWTRAFCDRLSQSRFLMKKTKEAWEDSEKRWIFYPSQILYKGSTTLDKALKDYFHYGLPINSTMSAGQAIQENAKLLRTFYDSDPRAIIYGKTVEQAAMEMHMFNGINTISYLVMSEFIDREIVTPLDPQNALFKIDRHKSKIPLNTNAIKLLNGNETIHHSQLIFPLEKAYLQYCNDKKLTFGEMVRLDNALWILGSEGCSRKNYLHCSRSCPLINTLCHSNVRYDDGKKYKGQERSETKGSFIISQKGKRIDIRRNIGMEDLFRNEI